MQTTEQSEFYVYLYRDIDGTPIYVGKGRGERAVHHKWLKTELGALLRERQAEGIPLYPVVVGCESEDAAFVQEQELIALHGRRDMGTGTLWNRSDGGFGFSGIVTDEYRAKLSAFRKGRVSPTKGKTLSDQTKQRMSEAARGKPKTLEHRAKMSAARKGRPFGKANQAINTPPHTEQSNGQRTTNI